MKAPRRSATWATATTTWGRPPAPSSSTSRRWSSPARSGIASWKEVCPRQPGQLLRWPWGRPPAVIESYEQALAIGGRLSIGAGEGHHLGNLGNRYADLGQTARAIEYYEQALVIAREIGDRAGKGIDLGNLADALIDAGRYAEAIQRAGESVKIGEEIGSPVIGSDCGRLWPSPTSAPATCPRRAPRPRPPAATTSRRTTTTSWRCWA